MSQKSNIAAALLKAQQAIESVKKDATNSFHRYNYTSAEEMIGACRKALHDHGLVATRATWGIDKDIGEFGCIVSTMTLMHADSGERIDAPITWPIVPEKGRPMDKAIAASLTSSLSYWLRDLLMLPREEEGMDKRDDRAYEPQKPTQTLPPVNKADAPKTASKPGAEPPEDPDLSPTPEALRKKITMLMERDGIARNEVEKTAVLNRMVPEGTPLENFNAQTLQRFIENWERVVTIIESKVRN